MFAPFRCLKRFSPYPAKKDFKLSFYNLIGLIPTKYFSFYLFNIAFHLVSIGNHMIFPVQFGINQHE